MALNTSQLAYFVAVAEAGQITLAAKTLKIAQPALSQAIGRLESRLGVKLFEREPRGVRLTSAGERFLEPARAALHAEADTLATAHALGRAARGALEVGFSGAPPQTAAPRLFGQFTASNPETQVSFRGLGFPTARLDRWLAEVDVALCDGPLEGAGVSSETLLHESRAALLHSCHPLAGRRSLVVAELLEERFCGFHADISEDWRSRCHLDDHRRAPPSELTSDRAASTLELVAAMSFGRSMVALPASLALALARVVPDLVAVPLEDAEPVARLLIWRSPPANPAAAGLIAIARSEGRQRAAAASTARHRRATAAQRRVTTRV